MISSETNPKLNLHPTEKKVFLTILEHRMIKSGDTIVVAVSGGPDSVCLLKILSQLHKWLDIGLVVAHLNHRLRPQEDEKESEFVANLAGSLNLALVSDKASNIARASCASLEERARKMRYQFFEKVLHEYHAHKVAIGHNMNDQAETVLMHLLRGTGPTGLSGIPPVREGLFIRPLINITRDEIHTYLVEKGIPFMIDSSNLEKRYLRNRIRLELIPFLLHYQPRLIQHLGELASLCRKENQLMEQQASMSLQMVTVNSTERSLDISLTSFRNLSTPLQYRVIRQAIKQVKRELRRIDVGHIKAIVALANSPKPQTRLNLPESLMVKKTYERLRFSLGAEAEVADFSHNIESRGRFQIPEINQVLSLVEVAKRDFLGSSPSPYEAFVDLDMLKWPLRVRNFRPGDRLMPLGLKRFKKLKEVFIDKKIPSDQRKKITILESRSDIVWVGGIRIDDRYKVKRKTKRILRCKIMGSVL